MVEFVTASTTYCSGLWRSSGEKGLENFWPNQWEVTYRNSIPKGTVWNSPSDWGFFKPLGPVPTLPGLLEGESFSGEWHFVIPNRGGRLHILWQHGLIPVQDNELEATVSLTLTARGPLVEGVDRLAAVDDGLELGHKTIVRSFRELMSDQANAYWGLKNMTNSGSSAVLSPPLTNFVSTSAYSANGRPMASSLRTIERVAA